MFSEKYKFRRSTERLFFFFLRRNTVVYLWLLEFERISLYCVSAECVLSSHVPDKCIPACSPWCIYQPFVKGVFTPVVMCAAVIFLGLDGCIKDTCEDNKNQFCSLDAETSSQRVGVRTPTC